MIEVRHPTTGDVAGLTAVARQWPTEGGSLVGPWDEGEQLRHLEDADYCVRVAVEDAQVLGYVAGSRRGRTADLAELMILPEHHRRGAGTQLVQAFEQWAMGVGCEAVELGGVVPDFYVKLGYVRRFAVVLVKRL